MTLTNYEAEQLWQELRDGFTSITKTIQQIVATRAWEPLGYDSFHAAWLDRLGDIPLATDAARAHVVYALFSADKLRREEVLEVAMQIKGIGPERAKRIAEQYENNVPAELVTTVRRHTRVKPSRPHILHVKLTPEEYRTAKEAADKADVVIEDWLAEQVREAWL